MVTCFIENTSAEKAYKRVGFSEWNRVTSPLWQKHIACPGAMNLKMQL